MLVLARKLNESIMIGDDVEVVVIDIKGDQVKLGIRAPKNVTVHRKEIYQDIKQENIAAIKSRFKPGDLRELSDYFVDEEKGEGKTPEKKDDDEKKK